MILTRHQLMRGNLDAFHCPNMSPLVVAGINIEVDYKAIHRPTNIEKVCRVKLKVFGLHEMKCCIIIG